MPDTYADNAENRRLGRVGMPKGSMPISRERTGSSAQSNGPAVRGQSGQQAHSSGVYADTPQNRKLGRIGKPKGSMPVSKGGHGGGDGRGADDKGATSYGQSGQQAQSLDVYADTHQNRTLGRVGMPKGSMPVPKGGHVGADSTSFDTKGATVHGQSGQQAQSPEKYADTTQNRKLGRVGMPKGSMPVSKGAHVGADGNGSDTNDVTGCGQNGQQDQSPNTYADTPQNRKLGRIGKPKGSMPVSKGGHGGGDGRGADNKGATSYGQSGQQAQSPDVYADTHQNRKLGRVGMFKGSMPVSKGGHSGADGSGSGSKGMGDIDQRKQQPQSSGTYTVASLDQSKQNFSDQGSWTHSKVKKDNQQDDNSGMFNMTVKYVDGCTSSGDSLVASRETKVYADTPQNRRIGRVGLPVGVAVFSSKTKTIEQRSYEDTRINRILDRVGKPRGCLPLQKKSSTTMKIPEMLKRIENHDEFKEFTFQDRTTCEGGLEFGLLDSRGERVEAYDQAWYRYNRQEAEQAWKHTNDTKEPPKTQVAVLQDYKGKKIQFEELRLQNVIGKGAFGSVYFAKLNDTVVAVKRLQNEKISNSRIKDFAREILHFCILDDHPNIVKFIGACVEKSNLCIVMEYMQMTLFDAVHIRNDTDFSEEEQLDIIRKVCNGMDYLHSKRIVHCDLKTHNILLDYVKDEICEVKITDFGLSMIIHDTSVSVEELVKNIGTPQYSPPEMLRGEILSAKDMMRADVYSLSLIFLEVIFKEEPFPDYSYQDLKKEVGEGRAAPEVPEYPILDQSIRDIMQQALSYEPTDRPSVARICEILRDKRTLSGS